MGKQWKQWQTLFSLAPKSLQMMTLAMTLKDTCLSWKESNDKFRQCIKKQRHYLAYKGPSSQSYGFSSSPLQMWELDHGKGWAPKNWCLELWCWRRLLRVPWTTRRSNQSILKEISSEYLLEGLILQLQYFGHLMWRANSLEKTDAGKDWGQEEKGEAEDEMVR